MDPIEPKEDKEPGSTIKSPVSPSNTVEPLDSSSPTQPSPSQLVVGQPTESHIEEGEIHLRMANESELGSPEDSHPIHHSNELGRENEDDLQQQPHTGDHNEPQSHEDEREHMSDRENLDHETTISHELQREQKNDLSVSTLEVISEYGVQGPTGTDNFAPPTNTRMRKPRAPPLIGPNGEPIKRKRGRPRKHPLPDPNQPPKKRGRPRKKKPFGIIGVPLASLSNLGAAVGWTDRELDRKLPSDEERTNITNPQDIDNVKWKNMVNIMLKLQDVAAEALYPANPEELLNALKLERSI